MSKKITGVCLIIMLCLLVGCQKKPAGTKNPSPSPSSITNPTGSVPFQAVEVPIYTISADLSELVATGVLIDVEKELTVDLVVSAVSEALQDNAIDTKMNQVILGSHFVTLDFDPSAPPVTGVSADLEELILDAYAQSVLDNFSDFSEVRITMNGYAYASAHRKLGLNEAYLRR